MYFSVFVKTEFCLFYLVRTLVCNSTLDAINYFNWQESKKMCYSTFQDPNTAGSKNLKTPIVWNLFSMKSKKVWAPLYFGPKVQKKTFLSIDNCIMVLFFENVTEVNSGKKLYHVRYYLGQVLYFCKTSFYFLHHIVHNTSIKCVICNSN